MYGQDNILMEDVSYIDKRGQIFEIYYAKFIDLFLHILRLNTKMRGSFVKEMFKNYPFVIFRDDVLEDFLGKECGRTKDGFGNGLGN